MLVTTPLRSSRLKHSLVHCVMAHYAWIVLLHSPRHRKWERLNMGPHHVTCNDAWILVESIWDFLVAAEEFDSIKVVRTIALTKPR